mmetsp:Transcript_15382/g.23397  ORF Transcript_15382/g.23397 Transcript_15382/m.23397 type:complete len:447 (-) Transcript_15382:76-1416(-)|eukprot:CAMPEP_0178910384 /NCGR_PEP_ID=MMETSP0786-20121207/9069_1 /TAXON_ID=186022 /ORGANISM="Thalassionema frauenfeldii, Strain CCMP 1798" /LENGTH=446 /DNA_ID=CAMNT_0020582633 /DNA_START=40 /DNA_END=1380 /DNA_ORIENTATION=-
MMRLLLLSIIGFTIIASSESFGLFVAKKKLRIAKKRAAVIRKQVVKTKLAGAAVLGGLTVGTTAAGTAAVIALQQQQNNTFTIYQPPLNSLNGQTIVITGGSSGLGLESAKRLALAGASIILTARTDAKGQAAVQAVEAYVEEKNILPSSINYKVFDLDDFESIRKVDWTDVSKIDVLLNNAGIMALPQREVTVDGYERQMQSNHLGHFLLTSTLASKFTKSARIINVSSNAHQGALTGLKFDYTGKKYGPWMTYAQTKLANIYFTRELQRRIDSNPNLEWKASTLHPGVISDTNLFRYNAGGGTNTTDNEEGASSKEKESSIFSNLTASFGFKTVPQGASTQVWLASGGGDRTGGKYYDSCKAQLLAPFCLNIEDGKKLWMDSEEIVGQTFNLDKMVVVEPASDLLEEAEEDVEVEEVIADTEGEEPSEAEEDMVEDDTIEEEDD